VSYENDPVPQASWDDLDDLLIAEYLRRREERLKERIQLDKIELLRALGLTAVYQDREVPNVAAVLLFGSHPEQPAASVLSGYLPPCLLRHSKLAVQLGGGKLQNVPPMLRPSTDSLIDTRVVLVTPPQDPPQSFRLFQ